MAGYIWDPVVRIVPRNGTPRVIVFADRFSDLAGHERADVRYMPETKQRKDVNRSEHPALYGWRPSVRFGFTILTMADQHAFAEMLEALLDPTVDVYLAMDACTFRRVVLDSSDGPDAIAGKTIVGARYSLGVRCADLIRDIPRMGNTANGMQVDLVQNGGFESWASSLAASWTYVATTGGTITQNTSVQRTAASCIAFARTGAGALENGQTIYGPQPGSWYRLSVWGKATAATTNGFRVLVRNEDRQLNISPDGKTWTSNLSTEIGAQNLTTSYTENALTFRARYDFPTTTRYSVYLTQTNLASGQTSYYDDCSLLGPYLPSGVSLW